MISRQKARHWCFTLNNPEHDELTILTMLENYVYTVFQLEVGESDTPHYQGYVIYDTQVLGSTMRTRIPGAHFEVAKGTPVQNRKYCTKEGRIGDFCESGLFPEKTPGARVDLSELHSRLQARTITSIEYVDEYFELFTRYPHIVTNYYSAIIPPRDPTEAISCTLLLGPAGTGKSRAAQEYCTTQFGPYGFHRHSLGKWWDGYIGQRTVIFDDFRGSCLTFTDFKRVIDRYPLRVEVKGTSCNLAATEFLITSNQAPEEWWDVSVTGHDRSAIFRRINKVMYFIRENVFLQFDSYGSYKTWQTYQDAPSQISALVLPPENEITYDLRPPSPT